MYIDIYDRMLRTLSIHVVLGLVVHEHISTKH